MFLSTVKQVKLEVRPLFLPQLVQLASLLKPGLTRIKVIIPLKFENRSLKVIYFPLNSGRAQNGWTFTRNVKMPLKHLIFWLYVYMIFT